MRRIARAAVPLLIAGALAAPASAGSEAGSLIARRVAALGDELDLDPVTRAGIQGLLEASWALGADLRDEAWRAQVELWALLEEEPPDQEAILAQVERVGEARTALARHRTSALLQVRSLLTREQWTRLRELREERRRSARETVFFLLSE